MSNRQQKEAPLVSVIIPAYNEREYIAEALQSVQRQTYDRLETIVVANACTDDTAKIAREWASIVIETSVQGISYAKNLGAQHTNGQVYAFMDADSQMKDDLLEKVYRAMAAGHDCGKAKIRPLDDERMRAKVFCWYSEMLSRLTSTFPCIDSGAGAFTFTTRGLFRDIEQRYGQGFRTDLQVMEDVDFLTKLKKHGNYKLITESCLFTSMRRFIEEGYVKCFIEDSIAVWRPEGRTRKRWNA
ncbi:glycosyltransferase [Candidatus Woesearchaeota archaeon]|nr:glycosyltransferase [Candidatus Woesearchaeota archaeon]